MFNPYVLLILSILLFSGNFIAGKIISTEIPPFTLAFIRSGIAFWVIFLFGWKQWKKHRQLFMKEWKPLYLLALTGIVLFTGFVYWCLHYTTTINAAIVEATTPIFSILLGVLFLKEKLNRLQIIGVLLSLFGVIWVILQGDISALLNFSFNIGDLIMLMAVLSWAVYSILVKKHHHKYPPYGSLVVMLFFAHITLLPIAATEWIRGIPIQLSLQTITGLLYIGIFPSIIALMAWNKAVSYIGPSRSSVFLNLIPVFTTILAVIFLNESMTLKQLFGGILVIIGVYFTTKEKSRNKVSAQKAG